MEAVVFNYIEQLESITYNRAGPWAAVSPAIPFPRHSDSCYNTIQLPGFVGSDNLKAANDLRELLSTWAVNKLVL
jgi:hypothetical protein